MLTKSEMSGVKSPSGSRVRDICCVAAGAGPLAAATGRAGAAGAALLAAAAALTGAAAVALLAATANVAWVAVSSATDTGVRDDNNP